jgi:hypothetical protein
MIFPFHAQIWRNFPTFRKRKIPTDGADRIKPLFLRMNQSWHGLCNMIGMTAATPTTIKVQGVSPMFVLDKIDLQRIAVSSVGALILSTACVFGAVGPARAATVAPQSPAVAPAQPVALDIR